MDCLLRAHPVAHQEFPQYAKAVRARVVESPGVPRARAKGRYRYLDPSNIDMDRDQLRHRRHEDKSPWVRGWQRARRLLGEQLQADGQRERDASQQEAHPPHPGHLGRMPVKYSGTASPSERATDIAFRRQEELGPRFGRWRRQAILS